MTNGAALTMLPTAISFEGEIIFNLKKKNYPIITNVWNNWNYSLLFKKKCRKYWKAHWKYSSSVIANA